MRIDVHPTDGGGCGYYRMIWPALAAKTQNPELDIRLAGIADQDLMSYNPDITGSIPVRFLDDTQGRTTVVGVEKNRADGWPDVIVFQRPLGRLNSEVIPFVQELGVKVVVELDDDFTCVHPRNKAFPMTQPHSSPERNFKHLLAACETADLVIVTTPALARKYAPHGRVAVIPNYVPERYLKTTNDQVGDDHIYIGWSGSIATHPTDLQPLAGALATVVRDVENVQMVVVGTGAGVGKELGIANGAIKTSGWLPIDEYPQALAQLDIGVVPLDLTPFNQAKSWLKGLEMASCGVPFVASPTAPYRELEALGIGQTASSPRHWRGMLRALASTESLRLEKAASYRSRIVELGMTIEERAGDWVKAWQGTVTKCS